MSIEDILFFTVFKTFYKCCQFFILGTSSHENIQWPDNCSGQDKTFQKHCWNQIFCWRSKIIITRSNTFLLIYQSASTTEKQLCFSLEIWLRRNCKFSFNLKYGKQSYRGIWMSTNFWVYLKWIWNAALSTWCKHDLRFQTTNPKYRI